MSFFEAFGAVIISGFFAYGVLSFFANVAMAARRNKPDEFDRCLRAYREAQATNPGSLADEVFVARILAVIRAERDPSPDIRAAS